MGACTFQTYSHGKSADEAYRNAKEEANLYNGHREGYSGDIQTTSGYSGPVTIGRKNIDKYIVENEDRFQKYGNCGCIELLGTRMTKKKAQLGQKGKRGVRIFCFFGWAAE